MSVLWLLKLIPNFSLEQKDKKQNAWDEEHKLSKISLYRSYLLLLFVVLK